MEHDPADLTSERLSAGRFESPAAIWWLLIPLGMALTGGLALSPGAYALFPSPLAALLSQKLLRWIFVVAIALHVLEGAYAASLASRRGLPALRWGAQTLLLGYPSLRLLLRRGEPEA
jgi:hypothetical protein